MTKRQTAEEVIRDIERGTEDSEYSLSGMESRIITALAAAGYVIVPREPSDAMKDAGDALLDDTVECAHNVWNAMLEALAHGEQLPKQEG